MLETGLEQQTLFNFKYRFPFNLVFSPHLKGRFSQVEIVCLHTLRVSWLEASQNGRLGVGQIIFSEPYLHSGALALHVFCCFHILPNVAEDQKKKKKKGLYQKFTVFFCQIKKKTDLSSKRRAPVKARRPLGLHHMVNLGLASEPSLDATDKLITTQDSIPKSLIINVIDILLGAIQLK